MELLKIKNWSNRNKLLVILLSSLIIQIIGIYYEIIISNDPFLYSLGITSFFFSGIIYLLRGIKDYKNRLKPFGEHIYSNNIPIAAILILLFIPIIFLPVLGNSSQLKEKALIWYEAGVIFISILTLLVVSIFKKLEKNPIINLIYPSKESNFQRLFIISFLIMSISPIFLVINEEFGRVTYYYDHFNTFIYDLMTILFLLWLLFMIFSFLYQFRKKMQKIESYEMRLDDLVRSNYFIIASSIILTFSIGIALEFYPNFLIVEIPSLTDSTSELDEGVWGLLFSGFLLYICIYMMFIGPQSLKILNKLSTVKEKTLGVKGIILALFVATIIFVILTERSRVEQFYWLILLIVILECFNILLIFWMFQNAPASLRFLRIPQIIAVIFAVISGYIIVYYAITSQILLIIIPFCFIFLNHMIANYLFLQFDFHSFLKREISKNRKIVNEEEVAQIFLIELLDFMPLEKKIEVAQRIVNFFENYIESATVKQIKREIEKISLLTSSEEYLQKIGFYTLYFEIATAYFQRQLHLKENVPIQFLVQFSALKVDDYFSLGILCSSFFEGFIRIVRNKLENNSNHQEESYLRKDGIIVANILKLPINEIHKIADIRNKFVHRNQIDFSIKQQINGILKMLMYSKQVLANLN